VSVPFDAEFTDPDRPPGVVADEGRPGLPRNLEPLDGVESKLEASEYRRRNNIYRSTRPLLAWKLRKLGPARGLGGIPAAIRTTAVAT